MFRTLNCIGNMNYYIPPSGTKQFVWRKILEKKKIVKSGHMHLQYTRNMRGIDATYQLQGINFYFL